MSWLERVHQFLVLTTGWKRFLIAFLAGALTAAIQAPFHLFIVGFLTFPVLIWLLDGAVGAADASALRRTRPAFFIGWWFGFGYFLAGLWWIANALLVEAQDFIWFIPLAICGLPALLAVFWGLASAFARAFWSEGIGRVAIFVFAFGLAELARGHIATGFPWNALGYAMAPTPVMMQAAAVIGVEGLTVLTFFVFALPALLAGAVRRARFALAATFVCLALQAGYGAYILSQNPVPIPNDDEQAAALVRIVQPSVDQSAKVAAQDRDAQLSTLLDLTSEPSPDGRVPDLIVWPETAVPAILTRSPDTVSAIASRLQQGQVLLTGAVRVEGDTGDGAGPIYYNSITALNDEGVIIDAADKVHLVPFGEYLPLKGLLETLGLRAIAAADRGYAAAPRRMLLEPIPGLRLLPLICYEAIFPGYSLHHEEQASVLLNVTNDAWFGRTPGPYQHFHQARMRAVEQGLPLIRAANNGISAVIDPFGRVVNDALALDSVGAMQSPLPEIANKTLYSLYGKYYLWLLLLAYAIFGITTHFWGRLRR